MDILKRSEVPEEFTWNLADMFESDEAWLKEYESLKELPAKIAEFQGKLGESAENLLAFMKLSDEIEVRISMFHGYANCKGDQDTGNSKYQDFRGKATAIVVSIMSAMAFSTPEIMEISDEKMEQFRDYLTQHGVFTTIRASRGQDIYAACGLLSTSKKIGEIRHHEDEKQKEEM